MALFKRPPFHEIINISVNILSKQTPETSRPAPLHLWLNSKQQQMARNAGLRTGGTFPLVWNIEQVRQAGKLG